MSIRIPDAEPRSDAPAIGPVTDRRSIDYMLSGARHQLTELSGQADLKANIVITTSALVLTLSLARDVGDDFAASRIALAVGVGLAFVCAVVAVIPKFRSNGSVTDQPVNLLFFGHTAHIPVDEYTDRMLELIRTDEPIYRAILADIHAQSRYLVTAKYRWLRLSYAFLLGGFVAAVVARLVVAWT